MARINIVNADNKIDATPQRAYFKLKQTGGPKGEKGDTGAQGPQGATGPQGASASVVVNSTTTLPAGSDATVENIGTPQNVKLNFGIPTGPQGPQGEQGPQGAQGPQGLKGDTGAKGADGAAAKVTVGNTNTGAAGTNAIVENIGSDTFAVLNFTIPRGDKGETGPMPDIAQTTGQATDEVMSQKATTDALGTKQNILTAGTGITIASDTVSADTTVLATKADLNDYAPQATTYTKTETDALLAPKLEADVVASLPATGEEGKLYLTPKNYTTGTASGNPITIALGEDAGQISSAQLDGDTFQQTYTGKNLFNVATAINNHWLNSQNGKLINDSNPNVVSDFIEVTSGTTYTISGADNLRIDVWQYTAKDENTGTARIILQANQSHTFTPNTSWIRFAVGSGDAISAKNQFMLEAGSTATSFEPYVGGAPSPSPDYPQAVQTVTGEQTVAVTGKNLFDKDYPTEHYYYDASGNKVTDNRNNWINQAIPLSEKLTFSFASKTGSNCYVRLVELNSGAFVKRTLVNTTGTTITLDASTTDIIASVDAGPTNYFTGLQIEAGQTATAYAPYSHQTLPLNLGTIELCKLGTYQDYIWKDGDDWKVHKATGAVTLTGAEYWQYQNVGTSATFFQLQNSRWDEAFGANTHPIGDDGGTLQPTTAFACDGLTSIEASDSNMKINQGCGKKGVWFRIALLNTWNVSTTEQFQTWLSTHNMKLKYALATATDTTITDSTLIAQLEAVRTASLQASNTITNTAAGANLAGDLELGYCEFDPTNRYNKWLWLDLNNAYEQLGS